MVKLFTKHPQSIGETYSQHAVYALKTAGILLWSGCALIIHALLPWLFKETASNNIDTLYTQLTRRKSKTQSTISTIETQ
ncbi:MAG: capsule biosynthesis protein [Legionellales bacterium]|nr:capsule biosynthesis protein [Legionellales bacterium]